LIPDPYVSSFYGAVVAGSNQSSFDFRCPDGEYIINFSGEAGSFVVAVNAACSGGSFFVTGGVGWSIVNNPDCPATGFTTVYAVYNTNPDFVSNHGIVQLLLGCSGSAASSLGYSRFASTLANAQGLFACPPGKRIVGFRGSAGLYLQSISFACAQGPFTDPALPNPTPVLRNISPLFGSLDGDFFNFNCPAGEWVVNVGGRFDGLYGPFGVRQDPVLTVLTSKCSGGKTFTTLQSTPSATAGIPSYPDCMYGYTAASLSYAGYFGEIRKVSPLCSNVIVFSVGIGGVDEFFACPLGTVITGITGYSARVSINSLSFTCGEVSFSIPQEIASRRLGASKSYDLVEKYPDCYSKLGPKYCPRPSDGFQFTDVYMVSDVSKPILDYALTTFRIYLTLLSLQYYFLLYTSNNHLLLCLTS